MRRVAMAAGFALLGCGGGAPLLHPAHVLSPGVVSMGAGVSGEATIRPHPTTDEPRQIETVALSPGVAPWVGGRVGIQGGNEGGLTYTGRAVRVDVRHAFGSHGPALSVGIGGSVVLPQRPGRGDDEHRVSGGGFDVPVLFGTRSRSDLYAVWVGPRAGFELLSGGVHDTTQLSGGAADPDAFREAHARHIQVGAVLGMRAGFRHLHAAVELDAAFHHVEGTVSAGKGGGAEDVAIVVDQVTLTPAGALVVTY